MFTKPQAVWRKRALVFCLFLVALYAMTVALSAAIFFAPWSLLATMNEQKRDQLISLGVFSPKSHPLYRDWLRHFARTPNAPRDPKYPMDTYSAYGVRLETVTDDENSDFLGFPNAVSPREAQVLFVGDSFCVGASVGSRRAPAALYGQFTNTTVYNGSNGGYGLAQYVGIIKKLTQDLPPEERFAGKDVVVMCYLGNDFNADILQYEMRKTYTDDVAQWLFKLGPLRSWTQFIRMSYGPPATPVATPVGVYAPIPMACETSGGLPFAWHPGYAVLLRPEINAGLWTSAIRLIGELKALETNGLRMKIVLVPANIQVVLDSIDWKAVPADSPIATDSPKIAAALNEVEAKAVEILKGQGFDVLDLTEVMRSSPDRCMLYQPGDTHCTALGFETIGKAIAARWPDLGKAQAK